MADFDSAWKETLDTLFEPFMAFFFPVAYREIDWTQPHDPLEQELQKITPASEQGRRVADKLFKVRRTNGQVEWVLGHLKTLQNAHNDDARRVAQVRLVKGLYERGYSAEQVRQLYRLMERMMTLPKPLAELAWKRAWPRAWKRAWRRASSWPWNFDLPLRAGADARHPKHP
jgi:hypothetical protein